MADLIGVMEGRGIWRWPKSLNHPPQEMPYQEWVLLSLVLLGSLRLVHISEWPYVEILEIDKRPDMR